MEYPLVSRREASIPIPRCAVSLIPHVPAGELQAFGLEATAQRRPVLNYTAVATDKPQIYQHLPFGLEDNTRQSLGNIAPFDRSAGIHAQIPIRRACNDQLHSIKLRQNLP